MGESHNYKEDEMADYKFGDGIKTFFLAGVGAVALTAEKGQEIIGELVKKGELTVEQGKEMSRDLQSNFKENMDKRGINIDELSQKISKMSSEELAKIKEQLAAAEKIVTEKLKKAEEEAAEATEEAAVVTAEAVEAAAEKACAAAEAAEDAALDVAAAAEDVAEKAEEAAPAPQRRGQDKPSPPERKRCRAIWSSTVWPWTSTT